MTVVGLVADAVADVDAHGLDGAHETGDLDDLLFGQAGDLGGPGGRELLHVLGKLVEAGRPVFDEVVVVQVLADDDVKERQGERGVGAGAHGQPVVGVCAEALLHRADVHDLHARFLGVHALERVALVHCGVLGVVAPHHQKLRLVQLAGRRVGGLRVRWSADGHEAREHALGVADA